MRRHIGDNNCAQKLLLFFFLPEFRFAAVPLIKCHECVRISIAEHTTQFVNIERERPSDVILMVSFNCLLKKERNSFADSNLSAAKKKLNSMLILEIFFRKWAVDQIPEYSQL